MISNGQDVNASVTNAAFMSRTTDTSTIGVVDLNNANVASGANVTNSQREHNSIASFIGKSLNTAYNALPTWASDIVGSANQTVKARIESIVARFLGTGGHNHDGTDGNGPQLSLSNLTGTLPISQGGTGQTSQTPAFDALSPNTTKGDLIVHNGTDNVRRAVGTDGQVLTADSAETDGVKWATPATPTFDSLAPTTTQGDLIVRNATTNTRKGVGADRQYLQHDPSDATRLIWDYLRTKQTDDSSTGNIDSLSTSTTNAIRLTGAAPVVRGIANGSDGKFLVLVNATGVTVLVKNADTNPTAANRILTGTGSDITMAIDSTLLLQYDDTTDRWRVVGGTGGGGNTGISSFVSESGLTLSAGFGTTSSLSAFKKQFGDSYKYIGNFTSGTTVASAAYFILPSGVLIDPTKVSSSGVLSGFCHLMGTSNFYTSTGHAVVPWYNGTDEDRVYLAYSTSGGAYVAANGNDIAISSQPYRFEFEIPVDGLSNQVTLPEWGLGFSLTPSAGFGTTSNQSVSYKVFNDTLEVIGEFQAGTVAASDAYFTLPGGYTIDTSKISTKGTIEGFGTYMNSTDWFGSTGHATTAFIKPANTDRIYWGYGGSAGDYVAALPSNMMANNTYFTFRFKVPITV